MDKKKIDEIIDKVTFNSNDISRLGTVISNTKSENERLLKSLGDILEKVVENGEEVLYFRDDEIYKFKRTGNTFSIYKKSAGGFYNV